MLTYKSATSLKRMTSSELEQEMRALQAERRNDGQSLAYMLAIKMALAPARKREEEEAASSAAQKAADDRKMTDNLLRSCTNRTTDPAVQEDLRRVRQILGLAQ